MTNVAIDRTENDPALFRQVLAELEGNAPKPLPAQHQPARDKSGRFTKKEPNHRA